MKKSGGEGDNTKRFQSTISMTYSKLESCPFPSCCLESTVFGRSKTHRTRCTQAPPINCTPALGPETSVFVVVMKRFRDIRAANIRARLEKSDSDRAKEGTYAPDESFLVANFSIDRVSGSHVITVCPRVGTRVSSRSTT